MATFAAMSGSDLPPGLDSASLLSELKGQSSALLHEFLYWEFHEGGFRQACLYRERWKAIRQGGRLRLFDTDADPAERQDVAADQPEIVRTLTDYLNTARTDSADWPVAAE